MGRSRDCSRQVYFEDKLEGQSRRGRRRWIYLEAAWSWEMKVVGGVDVRVNVLNRLYMTEVLELSGIVGMFE